MLKKISVLAIMVFLVLSAPGCKKKEPAEEGINSEGLVNIQKTNNSTPKIQGSMLPAVPVVPPPPPVPSSGLSLPFGVPPASQATSLPSNSVSIPSPSAPPSPAPSNPASTPSFSAPRNTPAVP